MHKSTSTYNFIFIHTRLSYPPWHRLDVSIFMYTYTYIFIKVDVCVQTSLHTQIHANTHAYIDDPPTRSHIYTPLFVFPAGVYIYEWVCICILVYIYVCAFVRVCVYQIYIMFVTYRYVSQTYITSSLLLSFDCPAVHLCTVHVHKWGKNESYRFLRNVGLCGQNIQFFWPIYVFFCIRQK